MATAQEQKPIDPFTVKIASWVIRTSYNILWSNLHKRLHKIPVKIRFSLSGMCDHRKYYPALGFNKQSRVKQCRKAEIIAIISRGQTFTKLDWISRLVYKEMTMK